MSTVDPTVLTCDEANIILGIQIEADSVYGPAADSLTQRLAQGFTGVMWSDPDSDRQAVLGALITPIRYFLSTDVHAPEAERPARFAKLQTVVNYSYDALQRRIFPEAIL